MVTEHENKVEKMYVDMYVGEGKDNPSMTTRMAIAEAQIERLARNQNKALWLAVSTLLGLGCEIVLRFVK